MFNHRQYAATYSALPQDADTSNNGFVYDSSLNLRLTQTVSYAVALISSGTDAGYIRFTEDGDPIIGAPVVLESNLDISVLTRGIVELPIGNASDGTAYTVTIGEPVVGALGSNTAAVTADTQRGGYVRGVNTTIADITGAPSQTNVNGVVSAFETALVELVRGSTAICIGTRTAAESRTRNGSALVLVHALGGSRVSKDRLLYNTLRWLALPSQTFMRNTPITAVDIVSLITDDVPNVGPASVREVSGKEVPSGLSYNTSGGNAGSVTGTPNDAGAFTVAFEGTNDGGTTYIPSADSLWIVNGTPLWGTLPAQTYTRDTDIGNVDIISAAMDAYPAPTYAVFGSVQLHTGLSLDANTGRLTGEPTDVGERTLVIRAQNTIQGTAHNRDSPDLTITVNGAPKWSTITPPSIARGGTVSYDVLARVTDAFPLVVEPGITLASGTLPTGLALQRVSALVTGTASRAGQWTGVVFNAVNSIGNTDSDATTWTVTGTPQWHATTINGTVGQALSQDLDDMVNAWPAITAIVQLSGTIPSSLTYNTATHVLSGTPVAGNIGDHVVNFSATNGRAADSQDITITIVGALSWTTIPDFGGMTRGRALAAAVDIHGYVTGGGTVNEDDVRAKPSNPLPAGLTYNTAGANAGDVTGTPSVAGRFSVIFQAREDGQGDFSSAVDSNAHNWTVGGTPVWDTTISLPAWRQPVGALDTITAYDLKQHVRNAWPAVDEIRIKAGGGSLPSGLTISSAGVIGGRPSQASNTDTITFQASPPAATRVWVDKDIQMNIEGYPVLLQGAVTVRFTRGTSGTYNLAQHFQGNPATITAWHQYAAWSDPPTGVTRSGGVISYDGTGSGTESTTGNLEIYARNGVFDTADPSNRALGVRVTVAP